MDASDESGTLCPVTPSLPPDPDPDPAPAPARSEGVGPIDSIGTYLAAQRRLRGINVEELSTQTRIPLRSLERLEAGSFDRDIDGFVRGFVRTVAQALGLDPDETLNRTLSEPDPTGHRRDRQLSLRRVAITLATAAALGGVGGLIQTLAISRAGARAPGPHEERVVRRDPVRDLADAQGVEGLSSGALLAPSPARAAREPGSAEAPRARAGVPSAAAASRDARRLP